MKTTTQPAPQTTVASPTTGTVLYSPRGVRAVVTLTRVSRSDGQAWDLTFPGEAATYIEILRADGWRLAG